jgi:hypothetical protein
LSTVIELGTTVSESRGSGAVEIVTLTVAVLETTLPPAFVNIAVIVVVPALTPVTSPDALTVATDGTLELHAICEALVTFCSTPVLPEVPSAMNCPVCPVAESASVLGVIASAVYCWLVPLLTVKFPVPATTVPPVGFVYRAVIVAVP